MENQQNQQTPQPQYQQTVVIVGKQKSVGVAFLLTFLFGPLGLLYASVVGGIVMFILGILIAIVTFGFGLVFVWIGCIIWAIIAVNNANKRMASGAGININTNFGNPPIQQPPTIQTINPQPQVQQQYTPPVQQPQTIQAPSPSFNEQIAPVIKGIGEFVSKTSEQIAPTVTKVKEFISKNKRMVLGAIAVLVISCGVYFFFLKFQQKFERTWIDAFIGDWTSYDRDLKISRVDTIYQIDYFDKTGQLTQSYKANKVGDLLSFRDNNGIGRQIQIFVPVNTQESKEGNIILDYNDSLNIRLITNDGDYYKKFELKNQNRLNGFLGTWKTKAKQFAKNYEIIKIDSTSQGIQVSWVGDPDQIWTPPATFNQGMLNISEPGVDGGIYATYFHDCDCITIGNDKYFRYDENNEKFLGHWKNNNGEIKISKNGNYYLVMTHQYQDYTFTFLTEVIGNELKEPFDKYAQGKTYTTITYMSLGVISDNGGETKYYNKNKYSKTYDYSYNSGPSNINPSRNSSAKSFSGKVGNLDASYNLKWSSDGTISGTYYYPKRPNTIYTLTGKDLGNGNIQLTEFTGNNVSAHCNLTLQGNCYIGQMNNTDGRTFKMTICQ